MVIALAVGCNEGGGAVSSSSDDRAVEDAAAAFSEGAVFVLDYQTVPRSDRLAFDPDLVVGGCETPAAALFEAVEANALDRSGIGTHLSNQVPRFQDRYTGVGIPESVPVLVECYSHPANPETNSCAALLHLVEAGDKDEQYVSRFNRSILTRIFEMDPRCGDIYVQPAFEIPERESEP